MVDGFKDVDLKVFNFNKMLGNRGTLNGTLDVFQSLAELDAKMKAVSKCIPVLVEYIANNCESIKDINGKLKSFSGLELDLMKGEITQNVLVGIASVLSFLSKLLLVQTYCQVR